MTLKELLEKLKQTKKEELPEWLRDETVELDNETVQAYLETDEGKKHLESLTDKRVTEGIKTFEEKTLPKLVEEGVEKKYQADHPEETPEQKRIRALEERDEKRQAELTRERQLNVAMSSLPDNMTHLKGLVGNLIGEDEDTTKTNVQSLVDAVKTYGDEQVTATTKTLAKQFGRNPESLNLNNGDGKGNADSRNEGEPSTFTYGSMED